MHFYRVQWLHTSINQHNDNVICRTDTRTFTSSPITPGSVPFLPAPGITYCDHVQLLLLKDTAEILANGQLHVACIERCMANIQRVGCPWISILNSDFPGPLKFSDSTIIIILYIIFITHPNGIMSSIYLS